MYSSVFATFSFFYHNMKDPLAESGPSDLSSLLMKTVTGGWGGKYADQDFKMKVKNIL